MRLVQWVYFLPLVLWLGMLVAFAAFFAPSLFRHLPGPDQAGLVVRSVLPKLEVVGIAVSVLALGVALSRAPLKGVSNFVRLGALSVALSCSALSAFVVTAKMERLREEAGGSVSSLDKSHPIRQQFGRLHGVSSGLMLLAFLAGLTAFALPPDENH